MGTILPFAATLLPLLVCIALVVVFYFIYRFITMNDSPFKAMKAIYVYVAAFVGLVLCALGFYQTVAIALGSLLDPRMTFMFADLASPLALLITGLFILVPHLAIGLHFHWYGTGPAPKNGKK